MGHAKCTGMLRGRVSVQCLQTPDTSECSGDCPGNAPINPEQTPDIFACPGGALGNRSRGKPCRVRCGCTRNAFAQP
eukprot:4582332-Lingulodinium_polyedra.AAC.1